MIDVVPGTLAATAQPNHGEADRPGINPGNVSAALSKNWPGDASGRQQAICIFQQAGRPALSAHHCRESFGRLPAIQRFCCHRQTLVPVFGKAAEP
jgi:hypothetical protein